MKNQQRKILKHQYTYESLVTRLLYILLIVLISNKSMAALNLAVETSLSPAAANERLMVKITVTNPTASTASNIQINMPYPANLFDLSDSLLSDGGNCTNVSGNNSDCDSGEAIVWNIANLAPGEGKTVYFPPVIRNTASQGALINFNAQVFENGALQASAGQVVEVDNNRTFSLSVDANHDPVEPNSKLVYDITYGHRGATATIDTEIRFTIPNGTSFDSAEDGGVQVGNEVVWDLGLIFPGKGGKRRVIVELDAGVNNGDILTVDTAIITGTANSTLHQANGNMATRVGSIPQLDFQMVVNADPIRLGNFLRTQLTLTNRSGTDLTVIKIELYFPSGLVDLPSGGLLDGGVCPNGACDSGETVTWNLPDLVSGSGKTVFLAPLISFNNNPNGRLIPYMARVSTDETTSRWERRTIIIDQVRKLSLAVDANHDPVASGSKLTYDLSYSNRGLASTINTELKFPIPEGTEFIHASDNGALIDDKVIWDIDILDGGKGGKKSVIVKLMPNVLAGDIITVDAATLVGEAGFVIDVTRASSTIRVGIVPQMGFKISVNADPIKSFITSLPIDSHATTLLTVTNKTNATLNGVKVEMYFPNGLNSQQSTLFLHNGDCSQIFVTFDACQSGDTITWNLGNIAVASGKTVSLNSWLDSQNPVPLGLLIPQIARAYADGVDDIWERSTIRVANRKLNLTVDTNIDSVNLGDAVTYDLTFGNEGDMTIDLTELYFPIPLGATYVSSNQNGLLVESIETGNYVVWDIGLLNSGESSKRQVTVLIENTGNEGDILAVNQVTIRGFIGSLLHQSWASALTRIENNTKLGLAIDIKTDQTLEEEYLHTQLTVTNKTNIPMTAVQLFLFSPTGVVSDILTDDAFCINSLLQATFLCRPGHTVFWNLGTLPPNGGRTVTYTSLPLTSNLDGRLIPFMARVTADNVSEHWDKQTMIVDTNRKLSLAIDMDQEPVLSGLDLSYQLTFGNRGNAATTNTELRFPIPKGTVFVSADGEGTLDGDEVVWDIGTLNPGDGSRRIVVIQMEPGFIAGDIIEVHQATIAADNKEKTWASSVQRVKANNNLDQWFMLNPQNLIAGETFDIDFTLDNMSPATMTGLGLTMFYPQYLKKLNDSLISDNGDCTDVVSFTNNECNSSETVIWNLPNMISGDNNMINLSPTINSFSDVPPDGTVIQFFAKAKNAVLDHSFITRTLLIGNFISAEQPEIDIQGNGQSIVSGDATPETIDSTEFGTKLIGAGATSHTFVISNSGTAQLNLTGNPIVSLTGNNDFSVITQPASPVAIGSTSNFTIAFNPSSVATVTATVSISNDDTDEDPYTFQVQGRGVDTDNIFSDGFEEPVIPMPPTLSLSANPATINSGESSTLTWVVANDADTCTKAGDWSGAANPANGQHSEVINNITSTSTYLLLCTNGTGSSPLQFVTVTVNQSGSPPTINSFTASPTTVVSGGNSVLTWSLSNNATACFKSGAWSGTLTGNDVANGSHSILIPNIVTASTYSLQCSNSNGNSPTFSVTVTIAGSTNCISQPPILGGAEDMTIIANATPNSGSYNGLYSDIQGDGSVNPWPGNFGDTISLSLTRNQYIAAEFNSGNNNLMARLAFAAPGFIEGPPSIGMTIAISECPGDFSIHLSQAKCLAVGGALPSFRWSTDPSANAAIYCKLDINQTYYLNIVHSNNSENDNYATSDCGGTFGYCGILATQVLSP